LFLHNLLCSCNLSSYVLICIWSCSFGPPQNIVKGHCHFPLKIKTESWGWVRETLWGYPGYRIVFPLESWLVLCYQD
jgi:hypothetical protein